MDKIWEKPIIIVSKCLNGEKCRYNGEDSPCKLLNELMDYVEFETVCPEVGIGLGIPRDTIKIVGDENNKKVIESTTKNDVTDKMLEFANDKVLEYKKKDIDAFILKGRSPSCGIKDVKIYKTEEKGSMSIKGAGIFAAYLIDNLTQVIIEEDGRLKNFEIRDNFLTKIFTLASFRKMKNILNPKILVQFHTQNKLLFMTYSPYITKQMGNIIANLNKKNLFENFKEYQNLLFELFKENQKFRRCSHVYEKAYGYVSKYLYDDERIFFIEMLKDFREGKQPKKTIITMLKGYAIRFDNEYLLKQTLLEPYPEKLLNLDDSGKGIVR
ncbi:MAG: YbgA family protein [Paraclostridium sp.]|uniref:YbgA family protein n=1 Tax=Paraclostridium sp. TaxID=2023273 RepID=UPI003F34E16B